jgi:hypothetical protein
MARGKSKDKGCGRHVELPPGSFALPPPPSHRSSRQGNKKKIEREREREREREWRKNGELAGVV